MDRVRVGDVRLRLTAPASLSGADLQRRAADAFLPAVLAAAERRLRARFGSAAVIRVPRLDVKLRLAAGDMDSAEAIEAVGADIADALAARVVAMVGTQGRVQEPERPRHYADQVEFLALRLAAAAAGGSGAGRARGPAGDLAGGRDVRRGGGGGGAGPRAGARPTGTGAAVVGTGAEGGAPGAAGTANAAGPCARCGAVSGTAAKHAARSAGSRDGAGEFGTVDRSPRARARG